MLFVERDPDRLLDRLGGSPLSAMARVIDPSQT
jgi:hypothetical protein